MSSAIDIGIAVLNPTGFLLKMLAEKVASSSKDDLHSMPLKDLEVEAQKQSIEMAMARAQAKVAQELAIARRIEVAEEVEIEEFYDKSGEGNVGVKSGETGFTVGAGGAGKSVTKRVYKFRGFGVPPATFVDSGAGPESIPASGDHVIHL
ncbi:hypothetical protein [Delftia acidovorans]